MVVAASLGGTVTFRRAVVSSTFLSLFVVVVVASLGGTVITLAAVLLFFAAFAIALADILQFSASFALLLIAVCLPQDLEFGIQALSFEFFSILVIGLDKPDDEYSCCFFYLFLWI